MSAGLLQEGHHLFSLPYTTTSSRSLPRAILALKVKQEEQTGSNSCLILDNLYDDLGGLVILITEKNVILLNKKGVIYM